MYTANQFASMIRDVFLFHDALAREPKKAFRKFDGKTHYGVHPTFLATAQLPYWCFLSSRMKDLIEKMTFREGEDYMIEIWNRGEIAILLKFYDCVGNLLSISGLDPERAEERKAFARDQYLPWIKARYPNLAIVKIAEGLIQ